MKRVEENRYPHSATLFKFCKEALEIRYEGNVKVIDQDVGSILGYDPADCSHWKKGKKNIRALSTLRSIADHLNIDDRLLIDIAAGQVGLEEAIFEFRGYGAFGLSGKNLESAKKEFFRNPTRYQQDGSAKSFEELFSVDRAAVVAAANALLTTGSFEEAPVYLPEVFRLFSNISLVEDAQLAKPVEVSVEGEGTSTVTTVKFRGPDMRPYVRFMITKELFKHLLKTKHPSTARLAEAPAEVQDIQANIFASIVLIPGKLLKSEVDKLDGAMDFVTQLAEVFWVSKSLMNLRLRDYLEYLE